MSLLSIHLHLLLLAKAISEYQQQILRGADYEACGLAIRIARAELRYWQSQRGI
jgi:hypothetical protein